VLRRSLHGRLDLRASRNPEAYRPRLARADWRPRARTDRNPTTCNASTAPAASGSEIAFHKNSVQEHIGARRLHTLMERLLDLISFEAADSQGKPLLVDGAYVDSQLGDLVRNQDLSRFSSVCGALMAPWRGQLVLTRTLPLNVVVSYLVLVLLSSSA
jgi:hypothetical protein